MEILINELSLKGQFNTVDEFVLVALKPLVLLLQQYDPTRDILLKKHDLYGCMVTSSVTLHELFKGSYSRTCDEIRKSKSQLSVLMDKPYWQDNRRHNHPDTYKFNTNDLFDSSLAESCERDKVVMSFLSDEYNSVTLEVTKNSTKISIDNLSDHSHLYNLVRARGIVVDFALSDTSRFKKTNLDRQGQLVYKELSTKCFWYLDNLHKNHYEVFDTNENHLGEADLAGNIDTSKRENGRTL